LQDIFVDAADLLEGAAASPEHVSGVAAQQGIVRQLESAGQLLIRKVDVEAKYLNRLEGMCQSDSDVQTISEHIWRGQMDGWMAHSCA